MERIGIIGGGQAAAALAAKLREEGFGGAITLIGAEDAPPYQRPPLSKKYLLGEWPRERLFLRPGSFYEEQGITLHLGTRAMALDAARRVVTLESGETLSFDGIALVTGARPRMLPDALFAAGRPPVGVHVLRTLADADALAPEMVAGRRLVIIGGGYIGLEAAAVARDRGLDVTLIEAAPRILARVACAETAEWFTAFHRSRGVTVITDAQITDIGGLERVSHVTLADGRTIETDLVLVGIGVEPETALAETAGLEVAQGILVDAFGRTSAPAIWAAGDCTVFPWRGRRIRLESVQNAIEQAEAVARDMLGRGTPYDPVPWFWSDQADVKLQIAGLGQGHDRIIVRESGAGRSHWYFRGDEFLAVDAINDPRAYMVGKRLLEAGRTPDPAALADPGVNLMALVRG